jgi:hypothetical protein
VISFFNGYLGNFDRDIQSRFASPAWPVDGRLLAHSIVVLTFGQSRAGS